MYCKKCGTKQIGEQKFCPKCGTAYPVVEVKEPPVVENKGGTVSEPEQDVIVVVPHVVQETPITSQTSDSQINENVQVKMEQPQPPVFVPPVVPPPFIPQSTLSSQQQQTSTQDNIMKKINDIHVPSAVDNVVKSVCEKVGVKADESKRKKILLGSGVIGVVAAIFIGFIFIVGVGLWHSHESNEEWLLKHDFYYIISKSSRDAVTVEFYFEENGHGICESRLDDITIASKSFTYKVEDDIITVNLDQNTMTFQIDKEAKMLRGRNGSEDLQSREEKYSRKYREKKRR